MKTIIAMLLLFAATAVTASTNTLDTGFSLTVEGKFLSESHVSYELYRINADSTMEKISKDKGLRWFSLKVEIGERYLVKFSSKSGQVKYLHIDAQQNGFYALDVDFLKKESATLKIGNSHKYEISIIPTDKPDFAVK